MNPGRLPVISSWSNRLFLFCAAAGLGATLGQACGPFFPATLLDQPGDELLRAPRFAFDLSGLLPTHSPWRAGRFGQDTNACQAAYLEGLRHLGTNDIAAITDFRRTRERATTNASDSALAAASIGWEARAELNRGNLIRAGELYIEHFATGDSTALMSLRVVAGKCLAADSETMRTAARHPTLNRVVTAALASRGGPFWVAPSGEQTAAWLAAVETAGAVNLDSADRLAWAAYQSGDFDRAKRWLARAPQPSASAGWLQTKLLLRDGKRDEATATLARTIRLFPESGAWPNATKHGGETGPSSPLDQARGELAALLAAHGARNETLDLLLSAGYWIDAAHIAERVMTVDELVSYATPSTNASLRHLTARRLARLNRYPEARPFLPDSIRPKLDELTTALAKHDADSLWQAAQIMRTHGLELTGTELDPDWHVHGGLYNWGFDSSNQFAHATEEVKPFRRYHYRYRAADLAWEAANRMPDNTDDTARVLYEAGCWLKTLDPKAADRFYKALVRRCGRTALGRKADQQRWF
jgi:tetratricopeptide (TPR) repeat protein